MNTIFESTEAVAYMFCKKRRSSSQQLYLKRDSKKGAYEDNTYRRYHQRFSIIKDVFRNFAKFTGKHLRQSLFFNKVVALLKKGP